jgi:hypothetical protein
MSVPKTCGNSAKAHAGCVPKTSFGRAPGLPPKRTTFLLLACTMRPGETGPDPPHPAFLREPPHDPPDPKAPGH